MKEINYKLLLEKYINYVMEVEGSDFIGNRIYKTSVQFSEQELEVLKELSNKVNSL